MVFLKRMDSAKGVEILETFKELLMENIITKEEYEAKKEVNFKKTLNF